MATEPPIEEVLDDILPDWREIAQRMAAEGYSHEEIVAEFQKRMSQELDSLLDFYNELAPSQGNRRDPERRGEKGNRRSQER